MFLSVCACASVPQPTHFQTAGSVLATGTVLLSIAGTDNKKVVPIMCILYTMIADLVFLFTSHT